MQRNEKRGGVCIMASVGIGDFLNGNLCSLNLKNATDIEFSNANTFIVGHIISKNIV